MISLLRWIEGDKVLVKIATFFGIGHISKAPGTWGSLAALPLAFGMMWLGPWPYLLITIAIAILAIFAAEQYEKQSHKHDSKEIVIDEVAGILVTMAMLPMTWQSFVFGFILFRILDIFKPFPIRYFDRHVPGGFGVVADDLVAGLIANIILQLVLHNTTLLGI